MTARLASVEPDGPLYRLGRHLDPWVWPDWSYAGPDGTFGNRYDDPEASYRVLYASQRIGAFVETLARFRPDLEVLAELDRIEGEDEPPAAVPRAWLDKRLLGEADGRGAVRRRWRHRLARDAPSGARGERHSLRARRD